MNETEFLTIKSYVKISSYRERVVKAIGTETLIPTHIAKKAGIRTNHISKTLGELKKSGICICINEDARKGRLYRLTELGLKIYNEL